MGVRGGGVGGGMGVLMGEDLVNFWLIGGVPPQPRYNEKPCAPTIFKTNQFAWFFCAKFFQKGFIFRIHFLYDSFLGESDLVGKGIGIRIVRFLVQTPPGAQPHLGTQPCYEAPGALWVEIEKNKGRERIKTIKWSTNCLCHLIFWTLDFKFVCEKHFFCNNNLFFTYLVFNYLINYIF